MLSARAGEEARIEGVGAGADDYLVKPFSARELLARVASHLALAKQRSELERALRYRGEQLETMFEGAPFGIYLVDADFRIRAVNPVARPGFGDIPGGVEGRDFEEVMHIIREPSYADDIVRIFRHTLATGEPYSTREHAVTRPGGVARVLRVATRAHHAAGRRARARLLLPRYLGARRGADGSRGEP